MLEDVELREMEWSTIFKDSHTVSGAVSVRVGFRSRRSCGRPRSWAVGRFAPSGCG
jgi:hypothetical protein